MAGITVKGYREALTKLNNIVARLNDTKMLRDNLRDYLSVLVQQYVEAQIAKIPKQAPNATQAIRDWQMRGSAVVFDLQFGVNPIPKPDYGITDNPTGFNISISVDKQYADWLNLKEIVTPAVKQEMLRMTKEYILKGTITRR